MPTIHRFYVEEPPGAVPGVDVELPGHVAHQVGAVLRLRPGDPLALFDGSGGEWQATLMSVGKGRGTVRLDRLDAPQPEPALRLTLCQAMIKSDRFEWVLQKGTELGVAAFLPLLTRRVVGATGKGSPQQREQERRVKAERWRRIVIEAVEQSGRTRVPELHDPRALRTVLSSGVPSVMCWESATGGPGVREAVQRACEKAQGPTNEVQVFIGPEGGFTDDEVTLATEMGAVTASLGQFVLRSETAAIAAAALALLD